MPKESNCKPPQETISTITPVRKRKKGGGESALLGNYWQSFDNFYHEGKKIRAKKIWSHEKTIVNVLISSLDLHEDVS